MSRVWINKTTRLLLVFAAMGLLVAAKKKKDELKDKDLQIWDSTKASGFDGDDITQMVRVEEIIEPPSEYRYAAFGKTDPFTPPHQSFAESAAATNFEIPVVSPLQQSIDSLEVRGIWELSSGERRALIVTPDKQGIVAKVGDPIGLSGKILKIFDNKLSTRQYTIREDGSREFEDRFLWLGLPEESEQKKKIILTPGKDPMMDVDGKLVPLITKDGAAPSSGGINSLQMISPATSSKSLPQLNQPTSNPMLQRSGGMP